MLFYTKLIQRWTQDQSVEKIACSVETKEKKVRLQEIIGEVYRFRSIETTARIWNLMKECRVSTVFWVLHF